MNKKRKAILAEVQRLDAAYSDNPGLRRTFYVDRFFIRTARIAAGALIVLGCVQIFRQVEVLNRPLGSLTLIDLFLALLIATVAVVIVLVAYVVAFGSYNPRDTLLRQARANVELGERTNLSWIDREPWFGELGFLLLLVLAIIIATTWLN